MFQQWIIQAALMFIVRQIAKYGESLDWAKVTADAKARVDQLLPGTFCDPAGEHLAVLVVNAAKAVLLDANDLQKIAQLAAEQKWQDAFTALKDMLGRVAVPADFSPAVMAFCAPAPQSGDIPQEAA